MRKVRVAAVQMAMGCKIEDNIFNAEYLVRKAAGEGANVILLPELFETKYFCQQRDYDYYKLAKTLDENLAVRRFRTVCRELGVVVPVSFFERDINNTYNSIAMIASTSSTSSTICHTLALEFIIRPPCIYISIYYSMDGLHLTRSSRHFVELIYQSTIAPPRQTCP